MNYKNHDALWKGIIEEIALDFIAFFLPEIYEQLDTTKGVTFLEQELATIFTEGQSTNHYVDKLAKIYLTTGEENWLLIHIDIQGYPDKAFAQRMFRYFYRIVDKHDGPVTALAVFTTKNDPHKMAAGFTYHCFGTKLTYEYNTYLISQQSLAKLLTDSNPFALVILAGKYFLASDNNINKRFTYKKQLLQILLDNNYPREKIQVLFNFIDGLLYLDEEQEQAFRQHTYEVITTKGDEQLMGIPAEFTNYGDLMYIKGQREGRQEGEVKGRQEGEVKGRQEGEAKGRQEGEAKVLLRVLAKKINHPIPEEYVTKIKALSEAEIDDITAALFGMQDITDLAQYLQDK